jgi:hypothetical protein
MGARLAMYPRVADAALWLRASAIPRRRLKNA